MEGKANDVIAEFSPTQNGLQESFRLTDYASLKGWGCKVPQKILLKLLEGLKHNEEKRVQVSSQEDTSQSTEPKIGSNVKFGLIFYLYNVMPMARAMLCCRA